jgi:hypothetical protein
MQTFAQTLATWALPGIMLVSALGALVMCLLVFRYGLPASDPDAPQTSGSPDAALITRAGPAAGERLAEAFRRLRETLR